MEQNIQFVNSIDSRLKVLEGKKPVYDLIKGVKATDMKYLESANGNSNTGTQYTIYMNENQILSDYIVEEVDFEVVFNLTTAAAITNRPFSNGNIAPRAFVLDSVSQQNQIVINGQAVSFNPQDSLQAMLSFNNDENYIGKDYQTGTLDYFTDLGSDATGTLTANTPQAFNKSGSLKSPLLDFTSSTFGKMGRFSDIELINTTLDDNTTVVYGLDNRALLAATGNQTRKFAFRVRQPLNTGITSLTFGENSSGFAGCTQVQFTRNFVSNLADRLVNYLRPVVGVTVNSITANVVGIPKLHYVLYTPNDDQVIPRPSFYPILDYGLKNQQQGSNTGPDGIVTITSQTLSLSVVPKCIYVWVCVPNQTKRYFQSDSPGYKIENIQLSYGGVGGQFSGMQQIQIYDEFMGSQGYKYLLSETGYLSSISANDAVSKVGMFGSVLRIPASQLGGIDWSRASVGSQYSNNLQIQVSGRNLSAYANTPSLFVQIVNDRVLSIDSSTSAQIHQGLLTEAQVRAIRKSAPTELSSRPMIGGMMLRGGNFFSDLGNAVKKGANWAWDHKNQILDAAKTVAPLVGLGKKKKSKKGSALRRPHSRRMLGGSIEDSNSESEDEMIGGAYLSKMALASRLR